MFLTCHLTCSWSHIFISFMVKNEVNQKCSLFPWHPLWPRWGGDPFPFLVLQAEVCEWEISLGKHNLSQPNLARFFMITYRKLNQIRFGGWGWETFFFFFCWHHVLVIKVPLLIKISDNLKCTVNAVTLMKCTMYWIQLYVVMCTIYGLHFSPDHASNSESNGLKQLSDGVKWTETRGK